MFKSAILVIASLALASAASGHPGHGEPGQGFGLAHQLTEPIHVLGIIGAVVAVFATVQVLRARSGA